MKKIKVYSVREKILNYILKKTALYFSLMISIVAVFLFSNLATDILQTGKISKQQLYSLATGLTFDGVSWPVKKITYLGEKEILNAGYKYEDIRKLTWDKVPTSLKVDFPEKISGYIKKYQNITLYDAWKYIKDPQELSYFQFMRRIVRTIWLASYKSKNIWKRGTGTHAGVDIIGNIGTPVYAIANGLVVEIKNKKTGFGKYIAILHKINDKYYVSYYGHLHSFSDKIRVGSIVKRGEFIGTIGNSGKSSGPHLHLQINKVFVLQDILNGKISLGWYHDLDGVKAYTIDPIEFVEKYYKSGNTIQEKKYQLKETKFTGNKEKVIQGDDLDIVVAVSKELENQVKTKKIVSKKAGIKGVKLNLVGNKIQVGYDFAIDLKVYTGVGKITLVTSNNNLKLSQDIIENPTKTNYKILVTAIKEGQTDISISDGISLHNFKINSYIPESEKIFGIKVLFTGDFNLLTERKLIIYPINRFGQKLNKKINTNFKVYFVKDGVKKLVKSFNMNGEKEIIYLKGKILGKSKLVLDGGKFYFKGNITTNIAKDYSYDRDYALSMAYLIGLDIIKGENGYLYPNRNITRRELLTILGRSILKVDYNNMKQEMLNYMKTRGKFFKDISGNIPTDVYIYAAWKKGIIKGENGYSLAGNYVSKAELLTIYTRLFKINTKENIFNVWKDLKSGKLKNIADTIKKYNLYPFDDLEYFKPGELVTREKAFEGLKRFIQFENPNILLKHSAPIVENPQKDLEQAMAELFDF